MAETAIYVLQETAEHKCYQCKLTLKQFGIRGVPLDALTVIEVQIDSPNFQMLKEKGFASFPVVVPDQNWDDAWCGLQPDLVKEHAKKMLREKELVA